MSEHTLGEWEVDPGKRKNQVWRNGDIIIATAWWAHVGVERAIAHARLISAAPDLLTACERLCGLVEIGQAAEQGRAAIAKAKGE